MSKLNNVWVISDNPDALTELCAGAAPLGERTTLVYAGDRAAAGADAYLYLGELTDDRRFVDYIPSIVAIAVERKPELIITSTTQNGRLLAGRLAAALGTSVLTDLASLTAENGVTGSRMVYGGAAFRTENVAAGPAVACVGPGCFEAAEPKPAGLAEDVPFVAPAFTIKHLSRRPKTGEKVNLAAAKKVVAVGRGFTAEEDLEMARTLARAVGAEIGCTRPISEEEQWMSNDRYIGVSGKMLKPELYIAIGISGQTQHMVGCNQSKVLFAINKDKNSGIFKQCDYGIVGDLNKILPQLNKKFE